MSDPAVPPNITLSVLPPLHPTAEWSALPVADRYRRLSQVADGFALIVAAAAENDTFVEAALILRDLADEVLNHDEAFTYVSPADCWERNLPLAAVGWRYRGMVDDEFDGHGCG